MATTATIIADSVSPAGKRIISLALHYPRRPIHDELMTHRAFCLAGDAKLEFDLPAGARGGAYRHVYTTRLDDFVDRWQNGARRIGSKPKVVADLSWIEDEQPYSVPEIVARLGLSTSGNLNAMCRDGMIPATKQPRLASGREYPTWWVLGRDVRAWRLSAPDENRYAMRSRLGAMQIRQLNETTGDIQTSHVVNATASGVKKVYEVVAGDYRVAGSADHLVYTADGEKTIGALTSDDFLIVRRFGKREDEKLDPMRLKKIDGRWRNGWQTEMRAQLIAADPLCRRCRVRPVEEVHHVVPVYVDPSRAFDPTNIAALCGECHDSQHAVQDWQGGTYLYGALVPVEAVVYRGEEPTFDLEIAGEFPNFIADGVVVHNSRSASGSRAIPVEKQIAATRADPFVPIYWGKNQKGMQAAEELDETTKASAIAVWLTACHDALGHAAELQQLGVHKQLANRLVEPWSHIDVIVTATEWENYFMLRLHEGAQPEIQLLAERMLDAIKVSVPRLLTPGQWHLPYITEEERGHTPRSIMWSVARCARVSYNKHGTSVINYEDDERLYAMLLQSGHMGPFEHQACANQDSKLISGNFIGWQQYRKLLPNESVWPQNPRGAEIRAALHARVPNPLAALASALLPDRVK